MSTTTTSTPTTTLTSGCFQDLGDGTIRDSCTGLQWEKKATTVGSGPDPSNVHDVDNRYTWAGSCSTSGDQCQPNAAAAATCAVNTGGGALGCGECVGAPCDVDPSGLGAITTVWDWLNQVNAANMDPRDALIVFFRNGDVNDFPKTLLSHVRAVRSGP